jgi:hypothetical protein
MKGISMILDHRDEFIREVASGKSFLEVGGLWGAVNEKATVAHRAGATVIGALDIWPAESEWWLKFRERCAENGLLSVTQIIGSIDNPDVIEKVGSYDVVHCAGVLYHCPHPFFTLINLRTMTRDILILTSAVMPPVVENEFGRVVFPEDMAISVPAISENNRKVIDHYIRLAYGGGAYGVNDAIDGWFFSDATPNYGPWWWLWSAEYLNRIVPACGFEIVKTASQFNGTGHLMMLRKIPLKTNNYGVF